MWRSVRTVLLLVFLGWSMDGLSAQEGLITGVVVAVEDEDGEPEEGVTGTLVTGGTRTQLGTTGETGTMEFSYGPTIPEGTRMALVYIPREQDGEFLVFPWDEEPEECRAAESTATEEDDCDRRLAFWWGVTDHIGIRLENGIPQYEQTGGPPRDGPGRWTITGSGIGTLYYDFNDVLGDQAGLTSSTGDEFTFGFGGSVEYSVTDRWVVGAGVRYNQHEITQVFDSPDPLVPARTSGIVDSWFWDAYAGPRFRVKQTFITLGFGLSFAIDELEYDQDYSVITERETRELTGWKGHFRSTLDIPVSRRFSARLSAGLTNSFEGNDADANAWFSFGTAFQLGR